MRQNYDLPSEWPMARRSLVNEDSQANEQRETLNAASVAQRYKPTPRECALLLLHLWRSKEQERGKELTRLRISEMSLKHLWGRNRISPDLVEEVVEWLAGAGVTLFFAGSTYGAIKTSAVESWARTTSKRLNADLREVAQGTFDFSRLEHLLVRPSEEEGEEDAG